MKKEERIERFETVKADLEKQGYTGEEHTISILKANILAIVLAGPIALIFMGIYQSIHGSGIGEFSLNEFLLFYFLLIVSMIVHEYLHGIGWSIYCKEGWKSIHIGVIWKALTPFCCCLESLGVRQYMVGGILPLVVLGFGGSILSIILGSPMLLALGAVNIVMAGGEITIMLMLFRQGDKIMMDHPTKCGFWAFDNKLS